MKGEFAKLTAAGAKVGREPYRMDDWLPNTWVATLADPDDNYFQLASPMYSAAALVDRLERRAPG